MTTLLAIDTATDALSLALLEGGARTVVHRIVPRQHQQQLFAALDEVVGGRALAALGLDAIAFGRGPGSFTGLRIAASAAQGLAYSLGLPVVGVSTLETQVRTHLRRHGRAEPGLYLSTIDARIGQLYAAVFHYDGETLEPLDAARVVAPAELRLPQLSSAVAARPRFGLGSGWALAADFPAEVAAVDSAWPELRPEAEDMFDAALLRLAADGGERPAAALPDYVQQRIGWKTLAEQGRRS